MTNIVQYQTSNFATYEDVNGHPVFDTFFVAADWGDGEQLYVFQSPDDRERAMEAFENKGVLCISVKHQDAFQKIKGGMRAWLHNGEMPSDLVWTPINIR